MKLPAFVDSLLADLVIPLLTPALLPSALRPNLPDLEANARTLLKASLLENFEKAKNAEQGIAGLEEMALADPTINTHHGSVYSNLMKQLRTDRLEVT